jgi:hypothetical protein
LKAASQLSTQSGEGRRKSVVDGRRRRSRTGRGDVLLGSLGQPSTQLAVPSPSMSVSGIAAAHWPGTILFGSLGQPSTQVGRAVAVRDRVRDAAAADWPGAVLAGSNGQPSLPSGVAVVVGRRVSQGPSPLRVAVVLIWYALAIERGSCPSRRGTPSLSSSGSQASPCASPSVFVWLGLQTLGQLSSRPGCRRRRCRVSPAW